MEARGGHQFFERLGTRGVALEDCEHLCLVYFGADGTSGTADSKVFAVRPLAGFAGDAVEPRWAGVWSDDCAVKGYVDPDSLSDASHRYRFHRGG